MHEMSSLSPDSPPWILMGAMGAALALLVLFIVAVIKAFTQKTRGWVVTAALCVVLGVVCLGTMTGQVLEWVGKVTAKAKLIEKPMESKNGRYSVMVPNGWSNMPNLNHEADLGAGNAQLEQYFMMFVEQKTELAMTLEEFSKVSASQTAERLKDGKMDDAQLFQISDFKVIQRRVSGEAEGVKVVFLHTSVETEKDMLQLLCWTLPPKETTAFPVFQEMLLTFRANDEKPQVKPIKPMEAVADPIQ